MGPLHSGVPWARAGPERASVDAPTPSRPALAERLRQSPARLPHERAQGVPWPDGAVASQHARSRRRSTWLTTGAVATRCPAGVRPP